MQRQNFSRQTTELNYIGGVLRKLFKALFLLTILVGIPNRIVLADPDLPLPRIPICGDQDGSESPFSLQCADFVQSPDIQYYQIPATGSINVHLDFVFREATYNNELGFFIVDDQFGTIGGIKPGEQGYYQALFDRATIIFPSGSNAYTQDVNVSLTGGDIIAFFLVQNNTLANIKQYNPYNETTKNPLAFFSLDALNPDGFDHFVGFNGTSNNMMQFGFEDQTNGGDRDYDDVVYNVSPPLQSATGFLDIPLEYSSYSEALQGSNGGDGPGYVNSWFDHTKPGLYSGDGFLTTWSGSYTGSQYIGQLNCDTSPGGLGISCYDGHDGIDFRKASTSVLAAAPGIVEFADWGTFGNQIMIDHGNCYATLYGHLSSMAVKSQDPVADRQPIGIMGDTGGSSIGTHLHFGVYYDPNCDGNWSDKAVVDPFGWSGEGEDPLVTARAGTPNASIPNGRLWKDPLGPRGKISDLGGTISTPGYPYTVIIPQGAVSSLLTFEILPAPAVAQPAALLRSTGYSFWLRVLEWLTGGSSASSTLAPLSLESASINGFNIPVTVKIYFDPLAMPHININQLAIQQWNQANQAWSPLTTNIDAINNQTSAQTTQPGYFDLQGPLICPADTLEPNDNYDSAILILANGTTMNNLFDIAQDEDWFTFNATAGTNYSLKTVDLAIDVDTILEIYDRDGLTLLASNDDSGDGWASALSWQAPDDGTYFIRVRRFDGTPFGCTSAYSIRVESLVNTFFDVAPSHMFWRHIEAFYDAGITVGCSQTPKLYCPNNPVTRGEMAIFIERALGNFSPTPSPSGMFTDVPYPGLESFTPFIEEYYNDGLTVGCSQSPLMYCPQNNVTRGEMAVFIERALGKFSPNPSPTGMFTDVPYPGMASFTPFIEQFYNDGITVGCSQNPLMYCPQNLVTRGEMAVFIVRAFGIPLP